MIEAGADAALDAQRRAIDGDRMAFERQPVFGAVKRQVEIEAGAEGELFERARGAPIVAAPKRQIQHRAGLQILQRHFASDEIGDTGGIGAADAGTLQGPAERVAIADRGGKLDDRALGRFGERADEIVGGHTPAGGGTKAERRDRKRMRFLALRRGHAGGDETWHRADAGRGQDGGGDEAGARGKAAPPRAAADAGAKIRHPIHLQKRGAQPLAQRQFAHRRDRAAEAAAAGSAGEFQSWLLAQKHGG